MKDMKAKITGLKFNDEHSVALIRYIKSRNLNFDTFNNSPRYGDMQLTVFDVDERAIKQLNGYAERHGLQFELFDGEIHVPEYAWR